MAESVEQDRPEDQPVVPVQPEQEPLTAYDVNNLVHDWQMMKGGSWTNVDQEDQVALATAWGQCDFTGIDGEHDEYIPVAYHVAMNKYDVSYCLLLRNGARELTRVPWEPTAIPRKFPKAHIMRVIRNEFAPNAHPGPPLAGDGVLEKEDEHFKDVKPGAWYQDGYPRGYPDVPFSPAPRGTPDMPKKSGYRSVSPYSPDFPDGTFRPAPKINRAIPPPDVQPLPQAPAPRPKSMRSDGIPDDPYNGFGIFDPIEWRWKPGPEVDLLPPKTEKK